ncbi:MAG: NAD kinase [Hyphomicrobiaceae bacterium]
MPKSSARFERVTFVASDTPEAQEAARRMAILYGNAEIGSTDVIVALGGDGLMLETLKRHMHDRIPIYGMNRGSVGFLMNEYREEGLIERLEAAELSRIHPLSMTALDKNNQTHAALAINEVSVFRETYQIAKLRISIDGKQRLEELACDGLLVSTPAGSTAYNLSAHGPILPINARLLALTPISPFRPRRWRGALLPAVAKIEIEVHEANKRPVSAVADNTEIRSVVRVSVEEAAEIDILMLFDSGHSLDERILSEQFRY